MNKTNRMGKMNSPSVDKGAKLTKAQRKALTWFSERDGAALFGAGDPSLSMVRRLLKAGFVKIDGHQASGGPFAFTRYAITPAGRAALAGDPS